MAITYTYLPETTDVGKVRLLIGDKDIADAVFSDEEIGVFLTAEGSVNLAAAVALESWAATYAANASTEKIGDYSYAQKAVENMLKLAASLRLIESGIPARAWGEFDLTSIPGAIE